MLTRASLRFYAVSNAMVVLGVAVAVAVLGGALLVGQSVRDSLREIALSRLGATDVVITAPMYFRASLADSLPTRTAPLVLLDGSVVDDASKRTAQRVAVYGIDERFGRFHGVDGVDVSGRDALVSPALARELGVREGDGVTLRVARPGDVPLATLQGRRETTGDRIRLTIARVLDGSALSEFSLSPSQGPVLAIYVPMARLQRDLDLGERANVLLLALDEASTDGAMILRTLIPPAASLDDLGLRALPVPLGETSVESRGGFLTRDLAAEVTRIAARDGRTAKPVLTYVANTIRIGDREIPYSTVTAMDMEHGNSGADGPSIWLNEWAAADLGAQVGDEVSLDYFLWADDDGLETAQATFRLRGIVPMSGAGGDRTLTPDYPGISDAADMTSWDPPFPVDLKRIRPSDEEYWDRWRAAPKAIVTLAEGQRLWGSRFGEVSSLRLSGNATLAAQDIDPIAAGFAARNVRADAIAAAEGTTDFGEYFLYFSFFLVVSALLLAYLFFAVGLEQRTREVGLLATVGYSPAEIRAAFVREAVVLAGVGAAVGTAAAVAYGELIMYGLRTWWVGAVGTTRLELHVDPGWLAVGVAGALGAGMLALWLGVRAMSRRSARSLLSGSTSGEAAATSLRTPVSGAALAVLGVGLIAAASFGLIDQTAGFFGAGGAWLVAGLFGARVLLTRSRQSAPMTTGRFGIIVLGFRQTGAYPSRSVLSLALIAFACFVLVSVGAFRKNGSGTTDHRTSGTGGYSLIAESVAPLMFDANTPDGRDGLGLLRDDPALEGTRITRFRLRPGDEASCLTLYKPTNPRLIAPEPAFYEDPRFSFAATLASTAEEEANPWRLLLRTFDDGAVAAIADQTTLMYVLHLGVGDDFTFAPDGADPIRLRIVAALADSVLQSELIIGEPAFVRLFPRQEGYRVWLIDAPPGQTDLVTTHLEDRLSDFGVDVSDTQARWASYHEVENTYLGTFQALGSLGLLLGTLGLGAVLARNVIERRREIGLLRAVGFGPGAVRTLIVAESLTLVGGGLALGAGTAAVAILPALVDRGQSLPLAELAGLLAAVTITGLVASLLAVRMAAGTPVVSALKSE